MRKRRHAYSKGEGEGYGKEGRYELNEIEKGYGLYKIIGRKFGDMIQEQRHYFQCNSTGANVWAISSRSIASIYIYLAVQNRSLPTLQLNWLDKNYCCPIPHEHIKAVAPEEVFPLYC